MIMIVSIAFSRGQVITTFSSSVWPMYVNTLCPARSQMQVAEGASSALRSLYGTRYTSGPGATTICKSSVDTLTHNERPRPSFVHHPA